MYSFILGFTTSNLLYCKLPLGSPTIGFLIGAAVLDTWQVISVIFHLSF
jgi:hypothetical protein